MTTYNCDHCLDTGKRLLPNGQHSDYVDCSCQAATERAELDVAVTVFVQSYEGDLQNAPADTRWFVHQRAVKMQAARIAELKRDLSQHKAARIAYASEFPLDENGEPDVGNIHANIRALKAQAATPSAPAVEQQPFGYFREMLNHEGKGNGVYVGVTKKEVSEQGHIQGETSETMIKLYTAPQAADTDKVREALDGLHNDIMNLPHQMPITKYAVGTEAFIAYKEGHRDARHAAAELVASMAAQAPVREVPEDLQLVPKISTSKMDRAGEAVIESESHCDCGNYPMPNLEKVFSAMLAAAPVQKGE